MKDTVLQTMSSFCDASSDPALWPEALALLAESTDADAAFIAYHEPGGASGRIIHAWGVGAKPIATYGNASNSLAGWLGDGAVSAASPSVWDDDNVVSDGIPFDKTNFAADWLHGQHFHRFLAGVFVGEDGHVGLVALLRTRRRGGFKAEAKAQFTDLLPHLQHRLAASEALLSVKTVQAASLMALHGISLGVALIRTDGGVLYANPTATAIINNGDILSLSNGALALGQPGRRGRFRELLTRLAAMVRDGEQVVPRALAVPRPSRQRPVSVLVWPMPDAGEIGPDEPIAIVFIGDPENPGEIDAMRLCDLYGLSRAEARVAALLAQGNRLDETAQILGVAYETVRKHLKQIFSKTGTDRQAELVRMLVGGPAALTNPPS